VIVVADVLVVGHFLLLIVVVGLCHLVFWSFTALLLPGAEIRNRITAPV
jgi:hypothetical protein